MSKAIQTLARELAEERSAVLVTVVESKGASPAKVGAQLVLLADGTTAGTAGGGKLEASILEDAHRALAGAPSGLHHYALTEEGQDSIGTLCGGEVTVFVQAYFPQPQLVIVGGGHIGRPLKIMAEAAGFQALVVDVEPGLASMPALDAAKLTGHSYVVLITTDHVSDEAALRIALKSPAPYIGMIGSLAKCRTIIGHLKADGIGAADLARVYAPIGLDLGCSAPQEIAVGILAEVIAVRQKHNLSGGVKTRRLPAEEMA